MVMIPDPDTPPAPGWSEPRAAYSEVRPGLSPYLHYFYSRRSGEGATGAPDPAMPGDAEQLAEDYRRMLRDLIRQSLD